MPQYKIFALMLCLELFLCAACSPSAVNGTNELPQHRLKAVQNHGWEQLSIGLRYASGLGVPQSDTEAVR